MLICNFPRSNSNDLNFERLFEKKEFEFSVDKLFWATENPCRKI